MSTIADYISTIRLQENTPEALLALDGLEEEIAKVDWRLSFAALKRLVEADQLDRAIPWVERTISSLSQYFTIYPGQESAFKTDLDNIGSFARYYAEHGDRAGMDSVLIIFPDLFNVNGKQKCGGLRSRCHTAGHNIADKCTYKFSGGEMNCPECGAPRHFCNNPPLANGRCRHHGGFHVQINEQALAIPDNNRALIYQNAFGSEKLSQRFRQAIQDPNYLSLAPEIALIASRVAMLIEEVDEIDYASIQGKIERDLKRMEKSIDKGDLGDAGMYARYILEHMRTNTSANKAWEQIAGLTSIVRGLTETERKRIIDAQRVITLEEMMQLRNRTLNQLVETIQRASSYIVSDMLRELRSTLAEDEQAKLITVSSIRQAEEKLTKAIEGRFTATMRDVMGRERAKEKRALEMDDRD